MSLISWNRPKEARRPDRDRRKFRRMCFRLSPPTALDEHEDMIGILIVNFERDHNHTWYQWQRSH